MYIFINIVLGIALVIVSLGGAGGLWVIFQNWIAVAVWGVLLIGALTAFVFWKFLHRVRPSLSPGQPGSGVLKKAGRGLAVVSNEMQNSPAFYTWLSVLLALILLAAFSLAASIVLSMEILEFSIKLPWVTMVSSYIWLVVVGSGLCLINSLGAVFGMRRYEMMARRIVFLSLISIIFGLSYILFHLGRPERVLVYNIVSPNFQSAISWMGALYSIYLVIVVLELWLLMRPELIERADQTDGWLKSVYTLLALKEDDSSRPGRFLIKSPVGLVLYGSWTTRVLDNPGLPKVIGTLALMTGIAALTMLGSVFAHMESRVLWYGAYYPVYFLISALFTGYALLLIITILSYGLRGREMSQAVKAMIFEMSQVLALLLAVGFVLTAYRMVSSLFDPMTRRAVMLLLKGPFSPGFWVFEVGLMSVVSAFLLLWAAYREKLGGVLLGSILVLIGSFVMRYDFVVAGQIFPNILERLPSHLPTLMEIFLVLGIFAAFLLVYSLGDRFLPLHEEEQPHHGE